MSSVRWRPFCSYRIMLRIPDVWTELIIEKTSDNTMCIIHGIYCIQNLMCTTTATHHGYWLALPHYSIKYTEWSWVGVTKGQLVNFPIGDISFFQKYLLDVLNHFHIWQVSPQLSCGDTCEIWNWYVVHKHCFNNSEVNRENYQMEDVGWVPPTPCLYACLFMTSTLFIIEIYEWISWLLMGTELTFIASFGLPGDEYSYPIDIHIFHIRSEAVVSWWFVCNYYFMHAMIGQLCIINLN